LLLRIQKPIPFPLLPWALLNNRLCVYVCLCVIVVVS